MLASQGRRKSKQGKEQNRERTHDNMHSKVERDRHPRDGRLAVQLGEAERRCRAVVEDVEEGCFGSMGDG